MQFSFKFVFHTSYQAFMYGVKGLQPSVNYLCVSKLGKSVFTVVRISCGWCSLSFMYHKEVLFETEVHTNNLITSWLQVESIELKYSDSTEATEKICEDCCPGIPYIVFSVNPSISLTLINPQPQSGHFTHIVRVRDGDNVARLAAQLTRANHLIKGMKLWWLYLLSSFTIC